jgi:hypothetical protein
MTPENQIIKNRVHEARNRIKKCPFCNSCILDRKVALYKELIDALYKVYCWCGRKRKHDFEMKEIRHLLGRNEYARFGDLVRFGGLIYKPKLYGKTRKAYYGLNMARAKEFFAGTRTIPVQITLDQITNEIVGEVPCYVKEFPKLATFLRQNGLYDYEKDILPPQLWPENK